MFTLTLSHSHTPTHSFTRTHSHTLTHTHSLTYTYSHVHLHTHIHIASILRVPFVSLTLHLGYDVTSCHFWTTCFQVVDWALFSPPDLSPHPLASSGCRGLAERLFYFLRSLFLFILCPLFSLPCWGEHHSISHAAVRIPGTEPSMDCLKS